MPPSIRPLVEKIIKAATIHFFGTGFGDWKADDNEFHEMIAKELGYFYATTYQEGFSNGYEAGSDDGEAGHRRGEQG